MKKVVINDSFGGFCLSAKAKELYKELSGHEFNSEISRTDPYLVQVVEELGIKADGPNSCLLIVKISNNSLYRIIDHDGWETLETPDSIEWLK